MREEHDLRILEAFADALVRSATPSERDDVVGIPAVRLQNSQQSEREILVEQKSHDTRRGSGRLFDRWRQMRRHMSGVGQRGAHLVSSERVLGRHRLHGFAGGKQSDDCRDVHASPGDAGLAVADLRVDVDAIIHSKNINT